MVDLPPGVLAVILAAALTYYIGERAVHGVKVVVHKVQAVAHKVVHPRAK
jgi:hypothetical protein